MNLSLNLIWKILKKREKIRFLFLIFLMVLNALSEVIGIASIIPLVSIIVKNDVSFLNNFIFNFNLDVFTQSKNFILFALLFIGIIFLIKNIFLVYYNWYLTNFHVAIAARLSRDIYNYYISIPYEEFSSLNSSKFIYNCTEAVEVFRNGLINLSTFILEVTLSLSICIFLFFLNAKMMLSVIILLSVIAILYILIFLKKNVAWGNNVKESTKGRIFTLAQTFSSIKDINIFSGEKYFLNNYDINNLILKKYQKYHLFFNSLPKIIFEILIVSFLLFVIYFMMQNSASNSEEILITLSALALAFFRLYPAAYRIVASLQNADYVSSVLDDIGQISKKIKFFDKEYKDYYSSKVIKIKNQLELKNVCLARKDKNDLILKDVNLSISKGSIVGIKGDTGSGKSTLLDIITGFLNPTSGKIIIDNNEVGELNKSWFNNISYISQNINLISDNLTKNIALLINEEDINHKRVDEAIVLSQLSNLVKNSAEGKNQFVGENSIKVSGGEKQRIGIARAFYFNRDINIFDESTNAIDEKTESIIMKNIKKTFSDKFTIIISHKEETLRHCDQIYNLKNGILSKV